MSSIASFFSPTFPTWRSYRPVSSFFPTWPSPYCMYVFGVTDPVMYNHDQITAIGVMKPYLLASLYKKRHNRLLIKASNTWSLVNAFTCGFHLIEDSHNEHYVDCMKHYETTVLNKLRMKNDHLWQLVNATQDKLYAVCGWSPYPSYVNMGFPDMDPPGPPATPLVAGPPATPLLSTAHNSPRSTPPASPPASDYDSDIDYNPDPDYSPYVITNDLSGLDYESDPEPDLADLSPPSRKRTYPVPPDAPARNLRQAVRRPARFL